MGSAQRRTRGRAQGEGGAAGWVGQPAAIYCRIFKARDEDQTGPGPGRASAFLGAAPVWVRPDAVTIIDDEAVIIREIFARYLEGASPGQIAQGLTARGEVTGSGVPWQPYAVRAVLASRQVTGIRVFRGEEVGEGDWPAIIDWGTWREVQQQRSYRASAHDRLGWRFYLLRGLVVCKKCGWRTAGSTSKDVFYMCARHDYLGPERCTRKIGAARLEAFVSDAAVELLTHLDVRGVPHR